jgi:acetylornithine deacetylase
MQPVVPQAIPVNTERLRRLLKKMIDIYSPSGKEKDVLDFLYGYLKRAGLPVVRQPVDDSRYNLLVMASRQVGVDVAFVGHVDTVYAYDLEEYGYRETGDRVQGLGSADMKGGCAAMIEAFCAFRETVGDELPASLALVVGEEENGDGAERLLEDHHFHWAIIGEPTDLKPCLGHYGYMEIQLKTQGRRVHASLANRQENAIEVLLNVLLKLTHHLEHTRPQLVYNIRDLFSARKGFAVSDRCEAWIDLHLPPDAPLGTIVTELEEVFSTCCREYPSVTGDLNFMTIDAGYELPARGRVIDSLQAVYAARGLDWNPDIFPSHSDANQLWAAGVKPVLLGAGKLEAAHTPEESVSFARVLQAAGIYADLLRDIHGY